MLSETQLSQLKTKEEKLIAKIINKQATKDGFWKHVEEIVALAYERWPYEMLQHEISAKARRETALNKFNATKNMSYRGLGGMPQRIDIIIKRIYNHGKEYPSGMTEKEFQRGFFKRYPQFSYAEKI